MSALIRGFVARMMENETGKWQRGKFWIVLNCLMVAVDCSNKLMSLQLDYKQLEIARNTEKAVGTAVCTVQEKVIQTLII